MTEFDERLREEFDEITGPVPPPDWNAVMAQSRTSFRVMSPRALVLVALVVGALLVVAALVHVSVSVVIPIPAMVPIGMMFAAPLASCVEPFQIVRDLTAVVAAPRGVSINLDLGLRNAIATAIVVSPVGASRNCAHSHR